MRIAVWHNLPSGGGKRALYDHIRGLVARGHTAEVWCPTTADTNYFPLGRLVPEHVLPLAWPLEPRLSDYWQITLEVERSLRAMEAHCRVAAAEINRGGFDILFANCCQFFYTTPIGRFVNLPSVFYQGEPCRWLYEAMPRLPWIARPACRAKSGSIIRQWRSAFTDWRMLRNYRLQAREELDNAAAFTRILVNSLFSRESILRAYGLDSDVCYLGIDTDHFMDHQVAREGYVVGIGSFQPLKNIRFAIEAVGAMSAPRPKLVWIGNAIFDQPYLDEMVALASDRQVDFLPKLNVSDHELINILNRASMMIYAPRLEPFGLAPLEAGACGVPVVAVAEGGVRETVVDRVTGFNIENNVSAAASALTRLQRNPTLARRLGANGRAVVKEKWSFEASTKRIEQRLQHYLGQAETGRFGWRRDIEGGTAPRSSTSAGTA
jgi:glycosyltransferase involved in cell wall biosynthesis